MTIPPEIVSDAKTVSNWLEAQASVPPPARSEPKLILRSGYVRLYAVDNAILYKSGMVVDADGAPRCYHPNSKLGLDALANAGRPGNWWGIATSNGRANGQPVIQGDSEPAPGFYVSTTSLEILGFSEIQQGRYVDASTIPFIVLPSKIGLGLHLGDLCLCLNTKTDDNEFGIWADTGPSGHFGEVSIAMADALKVPSSPRSGGTGGGIITVIFPGSGKGYQPKDAWFPEAAELFKTWGGLDRVKSLEEEL